MDRVLAFAAKATREAEVQAVESRFTTVGFETDRLKEVQTREGWTMGVRLLVDGRVGLSSTNDPAEEEGVVRRALELAPFGPEVNFELPSPQEYPEVPTYDPAIEGVTAKKMVEFFRSLLADLKAAYRDVLFEGGVTAGTTLLSLKNSRGLDLSYRKSTYAFWVSGTRVQGMDMLFVGDRQRSTGPVWDYTRVKASVLRQLDLAKNLVPAPAGRVPVLFTSRGFAGTLLGPLLAALNGRTVVQGASPLAGRLDEQAFDASLTLLDDPTIPLKPPARPWDEEGTPSRPLPLVEKGVVRNFLYDLHTAARAGARSTGSASGGIGSMPGPSASYLQVLPGQVPFDTMVANVQDGLLVEELIGAGQGNTLGGEIAGNVLLGYRIQNGSVTGRVKDTVIHCNLYHVLRDIGAIGQEAEEVGGFLSVPPILCLDVSVARKE
ncbi:MAG: TldD/PmbA family protein [Chloroflexi bacterium]|nr:TldD/PmbA family protein [Chloroflexota bacterium]